MNQITIVDGGKIRLATKLWVSHGAVSLREKLVHKNPSMWYLLKKHHGVFSHGGGKNTTLLERGKITSEINGFANVSLLALAKPTMIKFLFVSCCLHPSPPRSLPVTLEQKKKKSGPTEMSSRAAVLSFVPGLGGFYCCCRCSSTTMASHRGVVSSGKMGRFARCITDAEQDVDADWVGNLRVHRDETLAAAACCWWSIERRVTENDDVPWTQHT